jgi:DNA-binding GntR family transcriptional regulator
MTTRAAPAWSDDAQPAYGLDGGPRTLASAVYHRLRADVLACRLQPGEKLLIGSLAKSFSVSAVAVREALSRLVADGLVTAEDQRGFRVSMLSLADLEDVTRTRIELECLALRRSIARGDDAWRNALKAAWEDLDTAPYLVSGEGRHHETWSLMHARFHTALVAACGLDWLLRFRRTLFEQSERYRRLGLAVARTREGVTRDTRGEHLRIFEAAMAGDAETAAAELAGHFEKTARTIVDAYRDRGQTDVLPARAKR